MNVQHDPQGHRFFLEVPGGTAELVYRPVHEGSVDLVHTAVPEAAAGQGIGGKLAEAAFDWARSTGTRLMVSCPYVTRWLERHPEQRDLLQAR
jgi:predicted GNAT family acetyltransferase